MTLQDQTGQIVILADEPLDKGGEGAIFEVAGKPNLVAKVYHQNNRADKLEKLTAMLAAPPEDVSSGLGHFSICWPASVLFEPGGNCVGFLMPRVNTTKYHKIFCLYHFYDRQTAFPAFTWDNLLHAGRNLAFILSSLHCRGYVIGDVNESNFLVSEQALVTIVDCDSMQVRGIGRTFLCEVGKDEYIAPELYYDRTAVRRADQDDFSLAILLFLMLMEGFSPFDGIGDESPPEELILNGNSPYVLPSKVTPKPNAPPFEMLPATLQALFVRAFGKGHRNPSVRPTSEEFYRALAAVKVMRCKVERRHVYPEHNTKCPWCERAKLLGVDTFAVAEPEPVVPPTPKQATQAIYPNVAPAVQPQPQSPLRTTAQVQPHHPPPSPVRRIGRGWAIVLGCIGGILFYQILGLLLSAAATFRSIHTTLPFGIIRYALMMISSILAGIGITNFLRKNYERGGMFAWSAAITLIASFVLLFTAGSTQSANHPQRDEFERKSDSSASVAETAPISREDQREHELVSQAQQLFAAHSYEAALAACNEALILDAGDRTAIKLRQNIESALTSANAPAQATANPTMNSASSSPPATINGPELALKGSSSVPGTAKDVNGTAGTKSQPVTDINPMQPRSETDALELLAQVQSAMGGRDRLAEIGRDKNPKHGYRTGEQPSRRCPSLNRQRCASKPKEEIG